MPELKLEVTDAEGAVSTYDVAQAQITPSIAGRVNAVFCKPRKLVDAVPGEEHYRVTITMDNGTKLAAEFLEDSASTAELDLVDRLLEVAKSTGAAE